MSEQTNFDTCGCCERAPAPGSIYNRLGLPTLSYRVGAYGSFLRRALNRLGVYALPDGDYFGSQPLSNLTTRESDDPTIALVDATAIVSDVLTFYQERIANEGFLRTSKERRSILELARAIGYELNPGVAASTILAYTLEDGVGAPAEAQIPAGAKVMSVPGPGETPQVFETSEEIVAHKAWNAIKPRLSKPQSVQTYSEQVILTGTSTRLQPGDRVLLFNAANAPALKRVHGVQADVANKRTTITFSDMPADATPASSSPDVGEVDVTTKYEFSGINADEWIVGRIWSDKDLNAFLSVNGWDENELISYLIQRRASNKDSFGSAHALRMTVGFFGNNAPLYGTLPTTVGSQTLNYGAPWSDSWEIWKDQQNNGNYYSSSTAHVYLERSISGILPDSWVVFESTTSMPRAYKVASTIERSMAAFAMSGKTTGLELKEPVDKPSDFTIRNTVAHVQSEELILAEIPMEDEVSSSTELLELDGLVLGLRVGQVLILTGERRDAEGVFGTEALTIKEITHIAGFTVLNFEASPVFAYKRDTVTINANTVPATHGVTSSQILGSGNGAQKNQRFSLLKPPLTYVSASTPSGSESTLELRVNNILWDEASSLYPLGGNDQKYILRRTDDGKTEIMFGDGEKGARLPTGQNNVTARYRSGLGLSGNLGAGVVSMLMTRPAGVKGTINPIAASGGADAEKMDDARTNAPLTVRTLERIVTLSDYEDFTRAFAGIGKAHAVDLWTGDRHLIYITVAGADGKPLEVNSEPYKNLKKAVRLARDPAQSFEIGGFDQILFNVSANIIVDERYITDDVFKDVETSLIEAYSFARRGFGMPVTFAGVITCIQSVQGVVAVDLDYLYKYEKTGTIPTLQQILPAGMAYYDSTIAGSSPVIPAQLLLINTLGITLTEVQA